MKPSKEKLIYYAKYVFFMLTSIITTIINAIEKGLHNGIEVADYAVYKAWQFSMYNIMIDRIFVAGKDNYGHA